MNWFLEAPLLSSTQRRPMDIYLPPSELRIAAARYSSLLRGSGARCAQGENMIGLQGYIYEAMWHFWMVLAPPNPGQDEELAGFERKRTSALAMGFIPNELHDNFLAFPKDDDVKFCAALSMIDVLPEGEKLAASD